MLNALLILSFFFLLGCASIPVNTANSCSIFNERYLWYKHTKKVEQKWGTPIYIQLAIIKMESEFELREINSLINFFKKELEAVTDSLSAFEGDLENMLLSGMRENGNNSKIYLKKKQLERKIQIKNETYAFLKKKLEEAEIEKSSYISSIRIIDKPSLFIQPHPGVFNIEGFNEEDYWRRVDSLMNSEKKPNNE